MTYLGTADDADGGIRLCWLIDRSVFVSWGWLHVWGGDEGGGDDEGGSGVGGDDEGGGGGQRWFAERFLAPQRGFQVLPTSSLFLSLNPS